MPVDRIKMHFGIPGHLVVDRRSSSTDEVYDEVWAAILGAGAFR